MADMGERVRLRLREEMTRKGLSQQDIADLIQWSQSRVAQKLNGRTPITLIELEALAFAVGISPTEAVRDHGLEFCAEMSPYELRILEQLRKVPTEDRDAIAHLLGVKVKTAKPERHAKPLPKAKIATHR